MVLQKCDHKLSSVRLYWCVLLYYYSFFYRCCRVCAKTLGESCGGSNGFSGTCEPQLECISKPPDRTGICMGKLLIFFNAFETIYFFLSFVLKAI